MRRENDGSTLQRFLSRRLEGPLTAVPGYASTLTYHPNGLLAQVAHPNGVTDLQERDPNDMARPLRLRTSGASEDFDSGLYAFDGAGNVTKMGAHRYVYDLLSRIDEAQVEVPGTGCGEELLLASGTATGTVTHESCGTVRAQGSYTVGASGNVTLRAGKRVVLGDGFSVASGGRLTLGTDPALDPEGDPTDASQSFTYDRFGNLLSVTTEREGQSPETRTIGTNASTNRLTVAAYDLSGNVTSWSGREYRYDPFNMLWQTKPTNGNGHTFLYGPGDERLWAVDWTAGTAVANWVETWTLRDFDGSPLRQYQSAGGNVSGAWSLQRDYVWRGGGLLAAHTPDGLQHFHLDHLGSPRIITDSSGQTLAQHLYFPFGEEATDPGQDAEALKFTGHERDDLDASGSTRDLDYMHARYFSGHLGRFLSFDPVGGNAPVPQSWNRYSYVLGNPVRYVDPYGLTNNCFPDGICTEPIPRGFFDFLSFASFLRNLSAFSAGLRPGAPSPSARPGMEPSTGPCEDSSNILFDTLAGAIEDIGPISITGNLPLYPVVGLFGAGLSANATARPDGSLDLYLGAGGIIGTSVAGSSPGLGGSLIGTSTGGRPSGFGLRAAGAVGFGNLIGIPLGLRASGFLGSGHRNASLGAGVVGGASGSLTLGYVFHLADPVTDNCP